MTFTSDNTPPDAEYFPVFDNAGLKTSSPAGVGIGNVSKKITSIASAQAQFNPDTAQKLARECYQSSTSWLDSSRRSKWADSLAAAQGKHPSGSKYLSGDYRYRSRLFKPKTRSMIRKAEASTAQAFFANENVVNIAPQDDNDMRQHASANIMDRLLQYRLTKTIPWFQTLVGARQDAEIMGICVAKVFWKYKEKLINTEVRPKIDEMTGMPFFDENGEIDMDFFDTFEKTHDHPWIDLIAPENFRFDPGADWRNPISTSPYTIELIPMYVADAKMMVKSGKWNEVSDGALMAATDVQNETTRASREQERIPGKDKTEHSPRTFDICWIKENIIRNEGEDMHFLTLHGADTILTNPVPVADVYLHGIRPYVCGNIVTESHKTYPSSKVELIKDLQTQTNDIVNLRLDNIKLALNPRQFVKGGQGLDLQDLRTFMPGKTIITSGKDDPRNIVLWDRPPDMTGSAYQDEDRLNMSYDELVGGTSNSAIEANRQVYQAVGNMEMMAGSASVIEEYDQRVFAITFVEPIIRHLVLLEQAYETDPVILALAGTEAQLWQKFGINEITDELLKQELTIKINVGLGATNPATRLQNFLTASKSIGELYGPLAAMASKPEEVVAEIFSLCGYRDGKRFFQKDFDFKSAMQQMNQGKDKGQDPQQLMQLEMMKTKAKMQQEDAAQKSQAQQDTLSQTMAAKREERKIQLMHEADMQKVWLDHQLRMKEAEAKTKASENAAASKSQEKPSTVVQFDANDALENIGKNLEGLATHVSSNIDNMAKSHSESLRGIGEVVSHMAAHSQSHNDAMSQAIHKLASATQKSSAPKKRRVIRDEKGRLVGAEEYE